MAKAKTKQFQFQDCVDKRFLVIKAGGCITVNKYQPHFVLERQYQPHFVLERQHIYDSWNPIKSGHMQDAVCTLTNIWRLAQLSKPKFGKYEPT